MANKKRGIYLVANFKSQFQCENLVKSIRHFGCILPITIIHFGGKKITSKYLIENTKYLDETSFSKDGIQLIDDLSKILSCPRGFLLRFLSYFGEYDEFIYSDNDILALSNWNIFFEKLNEYTIVHADEEYTTKGVFNFNNTSVIVSSFGENALESCITAGHFCSTKSNDIIQNLYSAIEWMENNKGVAKLHDQALLILSILIGNIKVLNLCKNEQYLSTWAGDYYSALDLIVKIKQNPNITHIHYSGKTLKGIDNIDDLWTSYLSPKNRLNYYLNTSLKYLTGYFKYQNYTNKIKRKISSFL